ncbi:Zinc-regulated transporter 2 [Madurella mycetomatis]|uniref:Zinc-regulated transporter 2 n=1 Tax=Madurella mycetomatis TaxID=100816 RepID=A0A175VZB2_9PEZI|nr:Zinc-regulated transporter 2 [Madurella mycetomatis]
METLNLKANDLPWSSIPTELLLAELSRRDDSDGRPACGSGKRGSYDTGLHVFALFLILILSTLACGFPLFSQRLTKGSRTQRNIIFLCQHFGTGVLMATAFVHLLPTAFTSLTDPCLPYAFSKGYRPLAGFIAMVSALVVVALESYLTTRGASHSHSHQVWEDGDSADSDGDSVGNAHVGGSTGRRSRRDRPSSIVLDDLEATEGLVSGASPLPASTPTIPPARESLLRKQGGEAQEEDDGESLDLRLSFEEPPGADRRLSLQRSKSEPGLPELPRIPGPEEQKRMLLQCVLLEAGILFHSVFIGMALSVATGPTFAVFLLAISFHQSFEGLALGTRIAALHFPKSSPRPWLMVLAFGATTPIGQAIGLFVHRFYDPMSQTGLLMVGFMNAISSGLLLFAGLVQLLAEDFLSEKSYKTLKGRRRVKAFLAVAAGAGLMAVVGAFA